MKRKNVSVVRSLFVCAFCVLCMSMRAQSAFEYITRNRNLSASNYCIYPDSVSPHMTPPPAGKHPFYISHYGRHGSRYLSNRKGYDIPCQILSKADSLGKLTPMGQQALVELRHVIADSEGRWGNLSGLGKQQHRDIARRMMERFPEVFSGTAHIDARSTTVTRCILSMGSAIQQLVALNPRLQVSMSAARNDMWFMNHQDKQLRDSMNTSTTKKVYQAFCDSRERNPRLMSMLFTDSVYVRDSVDDVMLNYYLLKTGLIQQNTHMNVNTFLVDLFSYEEIHQFWQKENAWWYFMYGPSPLNGGHQPYTQRYLLRKIIADADSCLRLPHPGATLRYGHETVVLPLACLLGINNFDYQTSRLEDLEPNGWWACLVFPMASNIQFVFYRENPQDRDIVFKVLLNENEASLPIPTDMAPYYHWKDFREYYLRKLDAYDQTRE